jgi:hypothetical protein
VPGVCWRATKETNPAGCLSECNPKLHYDGQAASPTAGARGEVRHCRAFVGERRRRRTRRAVCQSAIPHSCDEIESKNRDFDTDIVIFAWQTYPPRAVHRHRAHRHPTAPNWHGVASAADHP